MKKKNETLIGATLIFLEISLLLALFTFLPNNVIAGVANPVNVITNLTVGNVYPDVVNVSINNDAGAIALTANATTEVSCTAVIRDYNGDGDVDIVSAVFYDSAAAVPEDIDDNNDHYTNSSCELIADAGMQHTYDTDDGYHSLANCTFQVEYYANPEDWICNVTVNDSVGWIGTNTDDIAVSQLLALGLPDVINYGTVNATFVSDENITNITNYGNVQINLTLEGYGTTEGDGLAMNCTLGNIGYIPINNQKYNLTASNPGLQTLTQFEANYTNLTEIETTKSFELDFRHQDGYNDAIKESYWRIYVPIGVAGTCNGTIIFGATLASE